MLAPKACGNKPVLLKLMQTFVCFVPLILKENSRKNDCELSVNSKTNYMMWKFNDQYTPPP